MYTDQGDKHPLNIVLGKMASLVMDMDEAFETYEDELARMSKVFKEEKG